jgi:hypothetical protein
VVEWRAAERGAVRGIEGEGRERMEGKPVDATFWTLSLPSAEA